MGRLNIQAIDAPIYLLKKNRLWFRSRKI